MDERGRLTFGSLFAGIGGLDLGFERAGMVCRWQVEIDEYGSRVLEKHWPNVRRFQDIRTFAAEAHPDLRVDCVVGGFPCQDISYAGKGAGLDGERSGLFYEAMRVVRVLEPRVVVLENVAALLTRGLDDVLGTLASIGFDAEWHCIPAAAVGAPHIRDRVFILGHYVGGDGQASRPRQEETGATRLSVNAGEQNGRGGTVSDTGRTLLEGRAKGERDGGGGTIKQHHDRQHHHWTVEPDVGRVAHGVPKRVDRLRGLGNAVVPQLAEWIGRRVMEMTCMEIENDI